MYRAAVRLSVRPGPAVVAGAAYGLGALTLWSFSEGRIGLSIAIAVLPAAAERVETAFARDEPPGDRQRFVAGTAVTLAVGIAAYPGFVLAIAMLVLVRVCLGPARGRGLLLMSLGAMGAAVLLFPFVPTLLTDGGRALASLVGTTEPDRLARLAIGPGPGTWPIAAFLPVGAVLGLGLVRGRVRGPAARAAVAAGLGFILSWLAAANYLPPALSNPPAYARARSGLHGRSDRVRAHLVHGLAPPRSVRTAPGDRRRARRRARGWPLPTIGGGHGRDLGCGRAPGADPARLDGRRWRRERPVPRAVADGRPRRRSPATGR